ncbi:MAG: phage tailspike protein [Mycobacteriaceae bacterium]
MTANILVTSPYQPFTMPKKFSAVFSGYVWCGVVDKDPQQYPVKVYVVNEDGSRTEVSQPLRTNAGGFLVYNGNPANFVTDSNHSLLVQDSNKGQVWYEPDMSTIDPQTAISILGSQSREALRRSYAEAGFNLVPGSFELGGTLANINDVLLQSTTGRGFTGPAGEVPPGSVPSSDSGFADVSTLTRVASPNFTPFASLSDKAMYMLGRGMPFNMSSGIFVFEKPVVLPNQPGTIPAITGQGNSTKVIPGFDSKTDSVFQFKGSGPSDFIRGVEIGGFEWQNPNKYSTGIIDIYQCLRGCTIRDITGFFAPRGIRVKNSYGAGKIENIRLYLYDTAEFNHDGTYGVICESNAVHGDTIETVGGYEIGQRYYADSLSLTNYNSAGADDSPRNMIRKALDITGRQVVNLSCGYIERPFVPSGTNVNDVVMVTISDTDQLSLDGINVGAGSILVKNTRGRVDNLFFGTNSNWIAYDERCEIREGLITHYSASSPNRPITGSFWGKHSSGKITREVNYNPAGYIPLPYFKSPFLFSTDIPDYRGLATTTAASVLTRDTEKGACFEYTAPQYQGGSFYITGLKPSRYYTVMFRLESVGDFKTYIIPETFSPQVSDKPATFYAKGNGNDNLCYVVMTSTVSGAIGCRIVHDNPSTSVFRVYSTQVVEGVATEDVYSDVFDVGVNILSTPYKIPVGSVGNYGITVTNSSLVALSNAPDGRLRVTTTSSAQGILVTVSAMQGQLVTCKAVVSDACSVTCVSGYKDRFRLSDNKSRGYGLIEANAYVNSGDVSFRISKDAAGVFDVSSIHIYVK